MMLGSSCSPCCDPERCTLDEFISIYNLFRSGNVSVSVNGSAPVGQQYVYARAAGYYETFVPLNPEQIFVNCSGTAEGIAASGGPVALESSSASFGPLDFEQTFSIRFSFDSVTDSHALSRRAFISGLRRGGRCTFNVSASAGSSSRRYSSSIPITAFGDDVLIRRAPLLGSFHVLDFLVNTEAVELTRPSDVGFVTQPNNWISGFDYGNGNVRAADRMIMNGTLNKSPASLGVAAAEIVPQGGNNHQTFIGFSNNLLARDVANGFPVVFQSGNANYGIFTRMPTQEYYASLALGATHRTLTSPIGEWWNNFTFIGGNAGVTPETVIGAAATFDREGVVVVRQTVFTDGPAASAVLVP